MLSRRKELNEYPLLAEPRTVRLRFCKTGALQYISHLDLQRTFARILTRAELPLWYTQGFNPHPKLVFGLPLPVGCESVCEMAEIRIERDMPCDEILRRLRESTTPELDFTDCTLPDLKFADISAAEYLIHISTNGKPALELADEVKIVLTTSPLKVIKRSKSGEKEVDIVPLIKNADVKPRENGLELVLTLAAGSTDNLSPEYVITALRQRLLILRGGEEYTVMRRRIFDSEGREF